LGLSWSWLYGIRVYNCFCNQCLSPLKLWVLIILRRGVLDTTLCDKVCQWHVTCQWFSPVSSANKTCCHEITEILLEVALNTITLFKYLNSEMKNGNQRAFPALYFFFQSMKTGFPFIIIYTPSVFVNVNTKHSETCLNQPSIKRNPV
jgi:hypothetical protein